VVGFVPSSIIGGAQYFEYFMRTAKSHLQDFAPSTDQKNINISILQEVLIPLPPLAEQKRIVARVNQLMSLCDELEAKLRQADIEKLMNAAVKHVLESVRDTSKASEEVFA
jgi:type I restriction enzyme, S subunit